MPRPCARWRSTCPSALGLALALHVAASAAPALGPQGAHGWIDRQAPVRFAPEADYPPFVFVDPDGRPDGLSVGMLELVRRQAGLRLQTLPARPLAEQLALVRARQADLLTSLRPTPERAQYLLFTQPYVSVPAVLVVRPGGAPMLAALDGQPVAVGAGYAVEAVVRARHPAVRWQPVPDDATALRGVAEGRYAAAVADTASLAHLVRREGLQGLVAAEHVGFEYSLAFAVRSDWPELRDLLDSALRRVPLAERQALLARWLPEPGQSSLAPPPRAPRATVLAFGLLAAGLALALWIGWRRR